ncbi:MAG: preprotein translocase subunit SecY, partial [Planctomycetota bacterium]
MRVFSAFRDAFKIEELRRRILFTFGVLVVFRLGAHIPLPGINPAAIERFQEQMQQAGETLYGLTQVFSGGAMGNLAVFALGIMPYITASIIMQLMTKVSPTLEEISKEGPAGQRKIAQYTRYLTIPICIVQGFFALQALNSMNQSGDMILNPGTFTTMKMVIALTGGAVFIMWLGEQISERGLGNGASVLIMAGIIARIPQVLLKIVADIQKGDVTADRLFIILALYVAAVVGIVFVTQAQRRIPIQHAKHFRGRRVMMGQRNYMPLKVNTAGVMPVIFASSLLIIPQLVSMVPGLSGVREM